MRYKLHLECPPKFLVYKLNDQYVLIHLHCNVCAEQTGLPVPYILEPYRTVPSICEPNRIAGGMYGTVRFAQYLWQTGVHPRTVPNRTEHFRAEPNREGNVQCGTIRYG